MDTTSIGKRIRQFRILKHWRQEDLAEKTGLSNTYIGMIERGEKAPKLETFITIANALCVSADQLLADVLEIGYSVKSSEITEKIALLPKNEQERIYTVINSIIKYDEKH